MWYYLSFIYSIECRVLYFSTKSTRHTTFSHSVPTFPTSHQSASLPQVSLWRHPLTRSGTQARQPGPGPGMTSWTTGFPPAKTFCLGSALQGHAGLAWSLLATRALKRSALSRDVDLASGLV